MPFQIGPAEIIIVLIIALLVLGPKRLPEAGKAVGRGMREFKDSVAGLTDHTEVEEKKTKESDSSPS